MIPLLLFSILSSAMVWLAGRRDPARDPRLTTLSLGLMAVFPLLLLLPKTSFLPTQTIQLVQMPEEVAGFSWKQMLFAVWIVGSVIMLVRLALGSIGLRSWRKRSALLDHLEDGIELRQLESIQGPVAAGVFRKVIYVPSRWQDWSHETQATVLLHELAHHRRHDPLLRWITSFVLALHWFNPLVRWMARRLAVQCEQACDRLVISSGVPASHYARLLCDLATRMPVPAGAMAMAETSSLELRVRHLLQPPRAKGFATLAILTLITVGGAAMLATAGTKPSPSSAPDREEVELRLSADPFPADHP